MKTNNASEDRPVRSSLRTYPESADYLRISERHLRKLVAEGKLRPCRISRRVLFRQESLDMLIEAGGK